MSHGHDRPVFACAACIAEASVGMRPEQGARTYRVDVTRRGDLSFYLAAASEDHARTDAEEIVRSFSSSDFDLDDDVFVLEAPVPADEELWVGGPAGGWETPPRETKSA